MISKTHEKNLKTLSAYLKKLARRKNVAKVFDMGGFTEANLQGEGSIEDKLTECGSVGCAVGHGPYAGIAKKKSETWQKYSERVFGTSPATYAPDSWYWLFAGMWSRTDNTPKGAAKRIDYYLKYGAPSDAYAQSVGDADLSYSL